MRVISAAPVVIMTFLSDMLSPSIDFFQRIQPITITDTNVPSNNQPDVFASLLHCSWNTLCSQQSSEHGYLGHPYNATSVTRQALSQIRNNR